MTLRTYKPAFICNTASVPWFEIAKSEEAKTNLCFKLFLFVCWNVDMVYKNIKLKIDYNIVYFSETKTNW